jgi:hypothetical protein
LAKIQYLHTQGIRDAPLDLMGEGGLEESRGKKFAGRFVEKKMSRLMLEKKEFVLNLAGKKSLNIFLPYVYQI